MNGSSSWSDVIAFLPDNEIALIINPTIKFESKNLGQADQVHDEMKI